MNNSSIIPYVPIAPRVKATDPEKLGILTQFFELLDQAAYKELNFNHTPHAKGVLTISSEQINDLIGVLSLPPIDILALKSALDTLTYPRYKGEYGIESPLWNSSHVVVWEFQLNQTTEMVMSHIDNNNFLPEELVGEALSIVRIWRSSVEGANHNPQIVYQSEDISNMLLMIETRLQKAVQLMD